MSNLLGRLEIEMEKKIFSFLVIFFVVFLGIDIVSLIMVQLAGFWIIYWYLIPLIVTLVISGVIIDKIVSSARRRAVFLLILIPEGALTLVSGFTVLDPTAQAVLWIFIGIFSGFTIVSILAFLADTTTREQRGKVAGFITGIAWMFAAIFLSWISSTIVAPTVILFIFAAVKIAGGVVSAYLLIAGPEGAGTDIYSSQSSLKESFSFIWSDKKFLLYSISFMLIWLAQGIFLPIGGSGQSPPQSYQQIVSIGFAAGALFLIVSGFLLDKQGRKQILVYGTLLATISFLSYYFPIGAVFLSGLVISVTTISVVLGDIAPTDAKGRYFAIFLLFSFTAYLVGYLIGLAVGVNPFVALACVIISAIAFIFIFLKGEEPEPPSEAPGSFAPVIPPLSPTKTPPEPPSFEPGPSDSEFEDL
jgi:MFS family permease